MPDSSEPLLSTSKAGEHDDQRQTLVQSLLAMRHEMLSLESVIGALLQDVRAEWKISARNLVHYLTLRHRDIRKTQELLVQRGLSSLGRCESFVLSNVESVLRLLSEGSTTQIELLPATAIPCDFSQGRALLAASTKRLFRIGDSNAPLIMVTMPSEAASNYGLIRDLLSAGMNVMRINCAHDDEAVWLAIIQHLRQAEQELGRTCLIAMDVAGPKLRTGPLEEGPRVVTWKPKRDEYGRVVAAAVVWITPDPRSTPPIPCHHIVQVSQPWWKKLKAGDTLRFRDASDRRRSLKVLATTDEGVCCEARSTIRVVPVTTVRVVRQNGSKKRVIVSQGKFGPLPALESKLIVASGDRLTITTDEIPGHGAQSSLGDRPSQPAQIGCSLHEVFQDVRVGDRVLFDDGKISGVVQEVAAQSLVVQIVRARAGGQRLKADKGMNFPDTDLHLPALTSKDIRDLEFISQHADMVAYSFVRNGEDIRRLHGELQRLNRPDLAVVLKIENRQAFENLPQLLLEAMAHHHAFGVMIARGDLAVECGWERLVEVQEEILWMSEAAHVPVIWATQVLEGLTQDGLPSRAELSDAGLAARAECVMLNKGPNVVEAVRVLHDILLRMQQHQVKKRQTFRQLKIVEKLVNFAP